ncbi:surface carbohydrate biosynthesis protein [Methylovorus glucosotrophus]|nr:surface carbohydrate biosynthesis protein [Methylovorus glucosotrophus]
MSLSHQRIIFLPVEIVERELDAKLLVALEALERGYIVYIGHYWNLPDIAKKVNGGFYLYKAMTDYRAKNLFLPLLHNSVRSGVLDEEGLIFPSLDYYVRTRIGNGDAIPVLTKIYSWGAVQSEFVEKKFSIDHSKMVVSGNPRIDLLRRPYNKIYTARAAAINEKHGEFVLVNTNFGPGNYSPNFGFTYHEHMRYFGRISTPEEDAYYSERTKYFENLFFEYIEMVKQLAKNISPVKVIVRPHPVEDHEHWRRLLSDSPNVEVIFEGSAIDWIVASKCLIHTGCTTGVEAFVLGKPIFRYNPNLRLDMESELPNNLGVENTSIQELISRVSDLLDGKSQNSVSDEQKEYLSGWVKNLNGPYSYERILDSIDQDNLGNTTEYVDVQRLSLFYIRTLIRNTLIRLLGKIAKRCRVISKLSIFRKALERVQRFPGIKSNMIRDRLNLLSQLKHGKELDGIQIKMVGPDIFRVELNKK